MPLLQRQKITLPEDSW